MAVISFARGVPAPECLPIEELADCAKAAIEGDGKADLLVVGSRPGIVTGRVTISGDRFIETQEGHRTERLIQNETELRTLLAEHFRVTDIDRDLLPKRNAAPE